MYAVGWSLSACRPLSRLFKAGQQRTDTSTPDATAASLPLQNVVAQLCESWWLADRPGRDFLVPQTFTYLLSRALDPIASRPADVKRVMKMRTALLETVVEGIKTNIPLHQDLMVDAKFMEGGTNIHYLEEWLAHRNANKR